GLALPEFPALETPASAPGSTPSPGGHEPGLGARALSLPDAPGASGGRHHLILVQGKTHGPAPLVHAPTLEWSWPHSTPLPGGFTRSGAPPPAPPPPPPPLSQLLSFCPAPQDSNIQACLPLTFTPEEYEKQDIQLVAALSVTLGLFAVELVGFFSGVSMFNSTQSLISIGAHCSASVALSFFIFERWECTTYWYIFVFCSALPAVTEIALFISVFGLKKKPF
uniref:Transmembrane protein 107 n=1 Tax=Sus scrofa TaxID=9823 RepID=A0A8D0SMT2_PIG